MASLDRDPLVVVLWTRPIVCIQSFVIHKLGVAIQLGLVYRLPLDHPVQLTSRTSHATDPLSILPALSHCTLRFQPRLRVAQQQRQQPWQHQQQQYNIPHHLHASEKPRSYREVQQIASWAMQPSQLPSVSWRSMQSLYLGPCRLVSNFQ